MITLLAKLLPAGWPIWAAEIIFYVVVTVVGLTAVHLFWEHKVAEPYRLEGDARTAKRLQPKIDAANQRANAAEKQLDAAVAANQTLQQSVTTLEASLKDADTSIDRLKKLAEQARAQARAAIAKAQAQAARDADLVARLTAVASGPPVAAAQACTQAGSYLSELATWRHTQ